MLTKLIPIAIALIAVGLVLLSRGAAKKKSEGLFQAAGIEDYPEGKSLMLGGQSRTTRIYNDTYVAIAVAKTSERNPATVVGTHRKHEGKDNEIEQQAVTRSLNLWIVYPKPYPMPFTFLAAPGEQPRFEGNFEDMSDLLISQPVTEATQALLGRLDSLSGTVRMDQNMLQVILPEDAAVTPELLTQAMGLWDAVRKGSDYPYIMQ